LENVEWYEKQAFNPYRNQVSEEKLWNLCGKEPWQYYHPHHELMIISKDMYSEGANFIFGSTIPKISSAGIILPDFNSEGRPEVKRNPNWFCEYDLRALQRNLRRLHW